MSMRFELNLRNFHAFVLHSPYSLHLASETLSELLMGSNEKTQLITALQELRERTCLFSWLLSWWWLWLWL